MQILATSLSLGGNGADPSIVGRTNSGVSIEVNALGTSVPVPPNLKVCSPLLREWTKVEFAYSSASATMKDYAIALASYKSFAPKMSLMQWFDYLRTHHKSAAYKKALASYELLSVQRRARLLVIAIRELQVKGPNPTGFRNLMRAFDKFLLDLKKAPPTERKAIEADPQFRVIAGILSGAVG